MRKRDKKIRSERVKYSFGILFLWIMFQSCSFSSNESNPLDVTVLEPVQRDFKEIKESKALRIITRYNSISYFLHNGSERGFEYDFLKAFADENGLGLEAVIIQENQNPIDLLNSGEGDVIAANYAINDVRKAYHDFSKPYNQVNQVVILPDSKRGQILTLEELDNLEISVRKNSSYYARLTQLKKEGYPIKINIVSEDWDTEAILLGVVNNEFEATVADDNLFRAAQTYIPELTMGPVLSQIDSIAWGIRSNAPELKAKLDAFIDQHYRIGEDGLPKRSTFLNVLLKRYFEDNKQLFAFKTSTHDAKYAGILSPFDNLIRPIADSLGVDWKMIVSIAAQESKFDPNAKSWAGAVGLMQINQRFSKYSEEELLDPTINIEEGIRVLKEGLKHYDYLDEDNKWAMVLATYNAGVGHVSDARRIAIDLYKDPNQWVYIEDALLKLMKREYYKDARYGFCRGIETVRYVKEVTSRYEMYNTILSISEKPESNFTRSIIGMGQGIN